jgi:hypothetical protein
MSGALLTKERADAALARLATDSDRIAESLVAMDAHAGHQLLRGTTPTGLTAQRWTEASAAMAALWEQFATYRATLDRARAVRDRRSKPGDEELAELTELLTGPVVELDAKHVPIERRGLTGPAHVVERITLDQLLNRMQASFDLVTGVLAAAESAWSAVIGRLDPLDGELHAVSVLAESVAAGDKSVAAAVNRIRRGLERVREQLITDLLTVHRDDPLPGLTTELAELRARLVELESVRATFDQRLAALDRTVSDVEGVEATARQTYAAVQEKIANPGLPEPTDHVSAGLRDRLRRLASGDADADWQARAAEAAALDRATTAALRDARHALGAITGLLDRRAELRGRLEAFQVKAARLGFAEDLDLQTVHGDAQKLLFTAPCDLPAATRALNRYQQALQDRERARRDSSGDSIRGENT